MVTHLIKDSYDEGDDFWCTSPSGYQVDSTFDLVKTDCLECLFAIDKFATDAFFRRLDLMNAEACKQAERDKANEANYRGEPDVVPKHRAD